MVFKQIGQERGSSSDDEEEDDSDNVAELESYAEEDDEEEPDLIVDMRDSYRGDGHLPPRVHYPKPEIKTQLFQVYQISP